MDNIRLQFISHATPRYSDLEGIRKALEGGCRWIQLRMKDATEDAFLTTAREAAMLCHDNGATLILDDHVEAVKTVGADGVHLGHLDMPVDEARKILGTHYIIGGTANTIDDVRRLHRQGADYIGCGPFRYTTTKKNLSLILGLDGYRKIVTAMRAEHINLPIVAIGGITLEDIPDILATGVSGIAVSGAILRADDPAKYTASIGAALLQS
ncbi:MAG: thiamine phosphate synthase [Prevotellaceae bacterium]|nr:thiamine phosphate synthase [Prevotellaceae bacterium]